MVQAMSYSKVKSLKLHKIIISCMFICLIQSILAKIIIMWYIFLRIYPNKIQTNIFLCILSITGETILPVLGLTDQHMGHTALSRPAPPALNRFMTTSLVPKMQKAALQD